MSTAPVGGRPIEALVDRGRAACRSTLSCGLISSRRFHAFRSPVRRRRSIAICAMSDIRARCSHSSLGLMRQRGSQLRAHPPAATQALNASSQRSGESLQEACRIAHATAYGAFRQDKPVDIAGRLGLVASTRAKETRPRFRPSGEQDGPQIWQKTAA
jgi:hypothetical protein